MTNMRVAKAYIQGFDIAKELGVDSGAIVTIAKDSLLEDGSLELLIFSDSMSNEWMNKSSSINDLDGTPLSANLRRQRVGIGGRKE